MHIDHSREKLIQVVTYFAQNVKKLGKVKLFKLLYFVDFMHFKDTGRSVTGLDYFAWKMGPVPVALHNELDAPADDWHEHVEFKRINVAHGQMLSVRALSSFDPTHFSRRELRLLESLAKEFRDASADDMIEQTHLERSPWHKVWEVEGSRQALIPYDYALRAQDGDAISELSAARSAFLDAVGSK